MADPAVKLTAGQADMIAACLETGAAWTTSRAMGPMELLRRLEGCGWMEEVEAPFEALASYRITDQGRRALLDALKEEGEDRGGGAGTPRLP